MTPLSGSPSQLTVSHIGKVSSERDAGEGPGGQELAEHGREGRGRQRHQQLDRAGAPLLGPEPHGDRRHQEQIEPGMEDEERREVGLPALEEAAEEEGERAGQRQEDDDEDVGQRAWRNRP